MTAAVLLDTHVVVWWHADGGRLSARARRAIDGAERLLVSPLTCWEITVLERSGRIRLDRDVAEWVEALMAVPRVEVAGLSAEAAIMAGRLDPAQFPGDPIDRLLYATARDHRAAMVSKDERIRAYAAGRRDVEVVW